MDKDLLSQQIGHRLRYHRQHRKLSLDELSDVTGVSKPMLGQIERGTSNPTVSILWKIASGLQVPFASFLVSNPSIRIRRENEQACFKEDQDLFETFNTFASPGIPLETYRIRLLPGNKHHSESSGIGVLKVITVHLGSLTIKIGEQDVNELHTGDSISFTNDVPQLLQNLMTDVCEINMTIFYPGPHI